MSVPPCKRRLSRGRLIVGGVTVPAVVLGSFLAASPASAADSSADGKGAVRSAFAGAGSAQNPTTDTVTLTEDLTSDGVGDDRLALPSGAALILDLDGHVLAVDRISLGAGSRLTVKNSKQAGRLLVGDPVSSPSNSDGTGIVLDGDATLTDLGATIAATGSADHAGIEGLAPTQGAASATVEVRSGGRIVARGGAGQPGLEGARLTVGTFSSVDVRGGSSSPSSSSVPAMRTSQDVQSSPAVTIASSGTVSTLGGALSVPAGATVQNAGRISIGQGATGAGTIRNDGSIIGTTDDIDPALVITGHNYRVSLDKGDSTSAGIPERVRVYADTLGQVLDGYVPSIENKQFLGWKSADGSIDTSAANGANRTLPSGSQNGEPVEVALTAVYKDRITFTDPSTVHLTRNHVVPPNVWIHGDDITSRTVDQSALPQGTAYDTQTGAFTGALAGLTFDQSTGSFGGTPTENGTPSVKVDVVGPYDTGAVSHEFHFAVSDAPVITTTSTDLVQSDFQLAPVVRNAPYSAQLAASGDGVITYSEVGQNTAGLSVSGTGVVSGSTAVAAGTYTLQVRATSSLYGPSETKTLTVHVGDAPVVTTTGADLGKATVGETYPTARGHLTATGTSDLGPVTFTSTGSLPTGLTLNSDGTFAGTASGAPGSYSFAVVAHSRYGDSPSVPLTIDLGKAPAIKTEDLGPLTVGADLTGTRAIAFAHSGTMAQGAATTWAISGRTPTGLTLDTTTGELSGTLAEPPAGQSKTYAFVVSATTDFGTRTRPYTVVTGDAPAVTTAAQLPNASVGGLYEKTIAVTGDGTQTFSLVDGTNGQVPTGLGIDSTGRINGSIDTPGEYTFTVRVHTVFGDADKVVHITADRSAGLIQHDLDPITVGKPYSATVANGGAAATYAVVGAALPTGLALDTSTGVISGTLDSAQTVHVTVKATNSFGSNRYDYTIPAGTAPAISTAADLGHLVAGTALGSALAATGTEASAGTTWSLADRRNLPTGVALTDAGALTGTFDSAGEYAFTARATTRFGSATRTFALTVGAAPVIATVRLPDGQVGTAYGVPVAVTGTADLDVTVTGLPAGLAYDASARRITGTPSAAGTATVHVVAHSAFYGDDSVNLPLAIAAAPAPSAPAPAPSASTPAVVKAPAPVLPELPKTVTKLGHDFDLSVAASSTLALTYSLKGDLPKGVAFDAAKARLSGAATQTGTFTFTVTATNSVGSDTQEYTLAVPEQEELLSVQSSRVTPTAGVAFDVKIGGLKKGERWKVRAAGRTLVSGTAAKAGSVIAEVTLPSKRSDTTYVVEVSGSRAVTDPAQTASTDFTVTAVTAKKALKIGTSGGVVTVTRLAPRERVRVTIDGREATTGRADEKGRFTYTPSVLRAGKHAVAVTGALVDRSGKATLKIKH